MAYTKEELSAAELRQPMPLPNGGLDASLVEGIRLWIENGASGDCNSNDTRNQGANDAGSSPQNPEAAHQMPANRDNRVMRRTQAPGPPQASGDSGPLATWVLRSRENFRAKVCRVPRGKRHAADLTLDGVLTALVNVESSSYPGHTYVVPMTPALRSSIKRLPGRANN